MCVLAAEEEISGTNGFSENIFWECGVMEYQGGGRYLI